MEHYQNIGYKCINGQRILVKTCDVSVGSGIKIDVQCDYCGKTFKQAYRRYLEHPNDIACTDCRYNKVAKTNLERYGNTCSLKNSEVQKKVIETSMKRYGVPVPIFSKQSIDKANKTKIKKYGTPYPLQNKEIWEKCNHTMNIKHGKGLVPISKNQKFLNDLYGGVLNFEINGKFVDMLLEYNICCEYDGGGHRMSVIRGKLTEEEFNKKELEREKIIIKEGYKIFRIVSRRDKLFDNKMMTDIKNKASDELLINNKDVYIYDIDNKTEKSYVV